MAHEQHARFDLNDLQVDPSRHIALYVQLASIFRHRILSGAWPAGTRLPNFETLAGQYKVARITVRQAVTLLAQEGLLSASRGRGTVVLESRARPNPTPITAGDATSPESPDLRIRMLYKGRGAALPAELRGDYAAFDRYLEVSKIHLQGGRPFGMMRIFVAEDVYRRFPRRAEEKRKLLRLVLAHASDETDGLEQTMTVEPADLVLSEHLGLGLGSPVAKITRRLFDRERRLLYAGIAWYRGDAFVMRAVLSKATLDRIPVSAIAPTAREAE